MEQKKLLHYKNQLLEEKKRINDLIQQMKRNETIDSNMELASEISFYDNHPSDLATEISDIEKGMALKGNVVSILNKIDESLELIEKNEYGICKDCGKEIPDKRLDFIPYAKYCTACQETHEMPEEIMKKERPVEEAVLGSPFGYGYNDFEPDSEFDAEDSYESVSSFNNFKNLEEYHTKSYDYVEPIEKISNQQYKNTLPD